MKAHKCATTEIAIRFKVKEGENNPLCRIRNFMVQYRDAGGEWKDADSKNVERVLKSAQFLGVQTITLVNVKHNPCYIVIWIGNKPYLVQVPCPK